MVTLSSAGGNGASDELTFAREPRRSRRGTRVALVQTRMRDALMDYRFQSENVGIGILAATLRRAGFEVDIMDAHLRLWPVEELLEQLTARPYGLIGFSTSAQEAAVSTFYVIDQLRSAGADAHITLGGHYPTADWEMILRNAPGVDSVVLGEGENTTLELADHLDRDLEIGGFPGLAFRAEGRPMRTGPRALIEDLDTIPFAARDDLDLVLERNLRVALTCSRGCYANCSFCTIPTFYGNRVRRKRSPENVVAEISQLYSRGARKLRFNDDIFIDRSPRSQRWTFRFCELIRAAGMSDINFWMEARATDFTEELTGALRSAGLGKVFIGIESASQSQLERYHKQLRVKSNVDVLTTLSRMGIPEVTIGFIMFDPHARLEDIEANVDFLEAAGQYHYGNLFSRLIVYKGTPLFETMSREGQLESLDWLNVPDYQFEDPRVKELFRLSSLITETIQPHVRRDFRMDIVDRRFRRYAREQVNQGVIQESKAFQELVEKHKRVMAHTCLRIFRDAIALVREIHVADDRSYAQSVEQAINDALAPIARECEALAERFRAKYHVSFDFEEEDREGRAAITNWCKGWTPAYLGVVSAAEKLEEVPAV